MDKVRIKICGLTTEQDIATVNSLGIDLAGFVLFFPKSKRNLDITAAEKLIYKLSGIRSVAVTVSPTPEQLDAVQKAGFDFIQVHGELYDETYEHCKISMIRAFNDFHIDELARCSRLDKIDAYLFDAAEPGSGKRCDWNALKQLPLAGKKLILAGGLTPDNVSDAIRTVEPDIVDVSSGVELAQGGKDPVLCRRFVENVRGFTE